MAMAIGEPIRWRNAPIFTNNLSITKWRNAIAAACDRPAIGLFAQSKPLDYNPNIKAVSVPDGRYGVPGGIASITPDQVFNAITAELRQIDDVAFREMQKT